MAEKAVEKPTTEIPEEEDKADDLYFSASGSSSGSEEKIDTKEPEPRLEHVIFLIEYHENIFSSDGNTESKNTWNIIFHSIVKILKEKAFNNDYIKLCIILYNNINGNDEIYHKVFFLFDLQPVTVDLIVDLIKLQKMKTLKIFDNSTNESDNENTVTCHFEDILFMVNRMLAMNCVDNNILYINKIFHFTSNWKIAMKDETLLMNLIKKIEFISEYYFTYLTKENNKENAARNLTNVLFKHVIVKTIQKSKLPNFLYKALSTPKTYNSATMNFIHGLNLQVNVFPLSSKIRHNHGSSTCYCNSQMEIMKPIGSYVYKDDETKIVNKEDLKLKIELFGNSFLFHKKERDGITHSDASIIKVIQFVDDEFITIENNILDNYFVYPKKDFYTGKLYIEQEMTGENTPIEEKVKDLHKEKDQQNVILFKLLVETLLEKKKIALATYFRRSSPIMVLLIPSVPPSIHSKKESMPGLLMKPYPYADEVFKLDKEYVNSTYSEKTVNKKSEKDAVSECTEYFDAKSQATCLELEKTSNESNNLIELFSGTIESPKYSSVSIEVGSTEQEEQERTTQIGNIISLLTTSAKTHKIRDHSRNVLKKTMENEIFHESRKVEPTYVNDIVNKTLFHECVEEFSKRILKKEKE